MSGTLINYKTENGIFKDFTAIVNEALKYFNIQGWQVRQLYQVLNVNVLKPTIFLSIITNPQAGAQYRTNKKINGRIVETYNTKQEVKIRFHAARKRSIKDDENTFNGIDVLDLILRYLQSPKGIELLKNYKYAQYRASDLTFLTTVKMSSLCRFSSANIYILILGQIQFRKSTNSQLIYIKSKKGVKNVINSYEKVCGHNVCGG